MPRWRRALAVGMVLVLASPAPAWAATKFYLQNAAAGFSPTTRGAWSGDCGAAGAAKGIGAKLGSADSAGVVKTGSTNPTACLVTVFVSDPLAGGSISGNLKFIVATAESNAAANITSQFYAWVTQGNSSTLRCLLRSNTVTGAEGTTNEEWGGAGTATLTGTRTTGGNTISLTTHPVANNCQDAEFGAVPVAGDRIVVEFGGSWNTANTTRTGTVGFGGTSGTDLTAGDTTADNAGYFEFSATIPLQATATPTPTATPTSTAPTPTATGATATATPTPTPTATATPTATPTATATPTPTPTATPKGLHFTWVDDD